MTSISHAFASELLLARKRKGYTQEKLASLLNVTTRWYQKIEKGESEPNLATTIRLLVYLEIDVQILRKEVEKDAALLVFTD